jgi:hypothetical protein
MNIVHHAQGFIWFDRKEGLNRFDRKEIQMYKQYPSVAISLNNYFIRSSKVQSGIICVEMVALGSHCFFNNLCLTNK